MQVQNAVGPVVVYELLEVASALKLLFLVHEAGALAGSKIVTGNGGKCALAVFYLDLLSAGQRTVAVAVGGNIYAAVLEQHCKLGVIDLGAGHDQTGAVPGLCVLSALFDLGQSIPELIYNEILRADLGNELNHMELVARYGRIIKLAQVAYLSDDAANFVVLLDRLADSFIGNVNTVDTLQRLEYMLAKLSLVMLVGCLRGHEGDIHHAHEEVRILFLDKTHNVKILMRPVHHLAGLGREHGGQEIVPALHAALKNAAGERAGFVGHVVCADVGVRRTGSAQTHREAAAEIKQHLRNEVAGVAQSLFALGGSLLDKLIVCVLKQTLKINQML